MLTWFLRRLFVFNSRYLSEFVFVIAFFLWFFYCLLPFLWNGTGDERAHLMWGWRGIRCLSLPVLINASFFLPMIFGCPRSLCARVGVNKWFSDVWGFWIWLEFRFLLTFMLAKFLLSPLFWQKQKQVGVGGNLNLTQYRHMLYISIILSAASLLKLGSKV